MKTAKIRHIQRPCIECGKLAHNTTRCDTCYKKQQQRRNQTRTHYKGDYRRKAAEIRDNAVACWICGEGARLDDPFTADHLLPSAVDSILMPAHRSCNSRRGADHDIR